MINWVYVREAIRQAVASAGGIAPESVAWEHQADAGTWQAFPYIELRIKRRKAWDDSTVYLTQGTSMVTEVQGPRELGLEIQVISDNQADRQSPAEVSELVQSRLGFSVPKGILDLAEVAIGTWGPTVNIDFRGESGRMYSASITEVTVNLAQTMTDTTAETDYIETVVYEADKLKLSDGSDSPLQPIVSVTKP